MLHEVYIGNPRMEADPKTELLSDQGMFVDILLLNK